MTTTIRRTTYILLASVLLVAGLYHSVGADLLDRLPSSAKAWVNKKVESMTLEERVGQLLMVPYFGKFSNTESEEFQELARQVRELHVGGLVVATRKKKPTGFDKTDVYGLARLTNRLQEIAPIPLLVSADFERGAHYRVNTTTNFPHNMTLGAADDPQLAYEMGRVAAQEARALGVHWVLAPVADVNNNPGNPVINIRSFGEDPQQVARMVSAFVRGVEENGALATAKHFPGHGDTTVDSHFLLPILKVDRKRMDAVELVPFRAALEAGVSTVMPGHLAVPKVEPNPRLPATFSRTLLTGLLRNEMGFDGLIITDAMIMKAITNDYFDGEAAVRSIEAGVDIILMPPDPDVAFDAIYRAVKSGRITEERLNQSVRRILSAKARLNLHNQAQVPLDKLEETISKTGSASVASKIAESGLTLLRDRFKRVPRDPRRPQNVFLLTVSTTANTYPGRALEEEIKAQIGGVRALRTDPLYFPPEEIELPEPRRYSWAIIAINAPITTRRGERGLPEGMAPLIDQVLESGKPTILLIMGSPYLANYFPKASTVLLSYSTSNATEKASAQAIFGVNPITGKLPVSLGRRTPRGSGLTRASIPMTLQPPAKNDTARMAPVFKILDEAVANKTTPGGVLAVGHKGRLVALHPFGRFTYDEGSPPVQADTLYDLASLTKVVGTTTAAMLLVEQRKLKLDAPVGHYLPEFARGPDPKTRQKITVKHLLTHSSGLPPYVRFFLELDNRKDMLSRIYTIPLEFAPGTKSSYSDLGIILLGEIIERVSGKPLDKYLQQEVFGPLGMKQSLFAPSKEWRSRIAPTEVDTEFRKRLIHGEVHDENAWVMGKVAPHAGLFSTARDLATFCQFLLNGGMYDHRRLLRRSTVQSFTKKQKIPRSTRAIGWDTPSKRSSGGRYLSRRAFGHTGFTGASIWIDPAKDLFVVLLTNRVHPTRENNQIRQLRPAVHDAVIRALRIVR